MRASESIPNYEPNVRQYANFAVRGIKKMCTQIGPRAAGSSKEREAQEMMAKELETCSDTVRIEEFKLAPAAFMFWVPVVIILNVIAVALFFLGYSAVSAALSVVCLSLAVLEFLLYKPALDVIMPKKMSSNAVGIRKATGETKRRIIFSGHIDSAMEWRFNNWGGPKMLISLTASGFLAVIASCVIYFIAAFTKPEGTLRLVLGVLLLVFMAVSCICLLFNDWKKYVDGANDNLTGSFTAAAVLKYLADNNIRFENTEVWAVTTGAEEAGLRGAKALCRAHLQEFKDTETVFMGLETLRDFEHMAIYSRDMTGTVKSDIRVCNLMKAAAQNVGLDLPFESVFFGSSDAAAVSQAGIPAATLASMDPAPARYYHTRRDTADNLDPKTIEAGLKVALETLFLYDEKGL